MNLANNGKAIISYVPLSRLLSHMPTIPSDEDPFKFKVLQAHKALSRARDEILKDLVPMTYSLGRAVGQLVEILCVPPKQFESGTFPNPCLQHALLILECE